MPLSNYRHTHTYKHTQTHPHTHSERHTDTAHKPSPNKHTHFHYHRGFQNADWFSFFPLGLCSPFPQAWLGVILLVPPVARFGACLGWQAPDSARDRDLVQSHCIWLTLLYSHGLYMMNGYIPGSQVGFQGHDFVARVWFSVLAEIKYNFLLKGKPLDC